MQILKARFHSREEFDEAYNAELPNGGLFVPTTTPLKNGEDVVVEIFCEGLPNKVMIRGEVKSWRPALPRLRVRAGALVGFPPEEDEKRQFLLAALSGEVVPRKRRHTRLPVDVPVRYRLADRTATLVGSLQSELGCSSDWQSDCAATKLAKDPSSRSVSGTIVAPPRICTESFSASATFQEIVTGLPATTVKGLASNFRSCGVFVSVGEGEGLGFRFGLGLYSTQAVEAKTRAVKSSLRMFINLTSPGGGAR